MARDPQDRRFVSVKEFAQLLRFHEQTIYRKIANGDIRGVLHVGRDIRIDRVLALSTRARRDEDE